MTILYFPDAPMQGDVDNIVKWMIDAMRPTIYLDDRQVERVVVQKFEPGRAFRVVDPSPRLAAALAAKRPLVYIRVDDDGSAEEMWRR